MKRKNWFRLSFIALLPLVLMQLAWAVIGFEYLKSPVTSKITLLFTFMSGNGNYSFLAWSSIVCLFCLGIIAYSMLLYFKNASSYEDLEKAKEKYHEACDELRKQQEIFLLKTLELNK